MKIDNFKLERFFSRYEFRAPYLLCSSDCESFSVKDLLSLEKDAEEKLKNLRLGYTETKGSPSLRKEISKFYNNTSPDDLIVLAGAEEGIFISMNVLLEKGDHVIVQFPAYQSLYEVAKSTGCEVTYWRMTGENEWDLDIDFLRKGIKKNTKAIIINIPHNPTGYMMPREKLDMVVEIAKKNDIFIFSDEVYRFLEYDEKDRLPGVADLYDKGVSLGVMSKALALPGLRIGWIATKDKALMEKIASFKDYTSICSSAPSEFLSALALRNKDTIIKRNLDIIRSNLKILDKFFSKYKHLFKWVRPRAGTIAFPKILFDKGANEFCKDLVNKKGVLLLPSALYDFDDKHFRIGFGRKNMPQALTKLEEYIEENL
jgi:aspartate/methionine/tyrosine aminotransferase